MPLTSSFSFLSLRSFYKQNRTDTVSLLFSLFLFPSSFSLAWSRESNSSLKRKEEVYGVPGSCFSLPFFVPRHRSKTCALFFFPLPPSSLAMKSSPFFSPLFSFPSLTLRTSRSRASKREAKERPPHSFFPFLFITFLESETKFKKKRGALSLHLQSLSFFFFSNLFSPGAKGACLRWLCITLPPFFFPSLFFFFFERREQRSSDLFSPVSTPSFPFFLFPFPSSYRLAFFTVTIQSNASRSGRSSPSSFAPSFPLSFSSLLSSRSVLAVRSGSFFLPFFPPGCTWRIQHVETVCLEIGLKLFLVSLLSSPPLFLFPSGSSARAANKAEQEYGKLATHLFYISPLSSFFFLFSLFLSANA